MNKLHPSTNCYVRCSRQEQLYTMKLYSELYEEIFTVCNWIKQFSPNIFVYKRASKI